MFSEFEEAVETINKYHQKIANCYWAVMWSFEDPSTRGVISDLSQIIERLSEKEKDSVKGKLIKICTVNNYSSFERVYTADIQVARTVALATGYEIRTFSMMATDLAQELEDDRHFVSAHNQCADNQTGEAADGR